MLLTLAAFAFAAELREDHPSTYTVQKGDTLWDISARFLKKPWLWPEIWQANPQVKNPHLIYPGDVLSLAYLNGQPMLTSSGPSVRTGEPIDTIPLSEIEAFLEPLTFVEDIKSLPYVIGMAEGRLLGSAGQSIYVRGLANAQVGQPVRIARPINAYALGRIKDGRFTGGLTPLDFRGDRRHQHWSDLDSKGEAYGKVIGYEMITQAQGDVLRVQGDVAVVALRQEEGLDVRVGDRVLPPALPYEAQFVPHPPGAMPAVARILAVADGVRVGGPNRVVALSMGAFDGISNGTTFSIWHDGAVVPDTVMHPNLIDAKSYKVTLPDDYVGHVMVFRTFDRISYGLIMDSVRPTHVGDKLKHPDAME
jgi:hypothetical protein